MSTMKSLDTLLGTLRLQSALQNRVVLGEPWGIEFPADPGTGKFHYVEQGETYVTIPGYPTLRVAAGDFLLVRTDLGYTAQDAGGTPPTGSIKARKGAAQLFVSEASSSPQPSRGIGAGGPERIAT